MKVHISNIYGFVKDNKIAALQKYIAGIGRDLNFLEMGLFCYDTSSDSYEEMVKRIDGIIASVEPSDLVILQLPTGNGLHYESLLINRIKVMGGNLILMMEDFYQDSKITDFDGADIVYAKNQLVLEDCACKGVRREKLQVMQAIEDRSRLEGKYALLSMIKPFYEKNYDEQKAPGEDMIHVCFGLHDKNGTYSIEVGVVMQSIVENTNAKICFHIFIDDTVSKENQRRLRCIANRAGDVVKFHEIDVGRISVDDKYFQIFTIGAMFRLLIPDILSDLKKIIYLDADLLFNKDIQELWDVDVENYCFAAAKDGSAMEGYSNELIERKLVEREKYFNSGVLVMNLDNIRKAGDLAQNVIDVLSTTLKNSIWPDQDALNFLFSEKTLSIDESWNTLINDAIKWNVDLKNRVFHYAGRKFIKYEDKRSWDDEYLRIKNSLNWPNNSITEYGWAYNCLLSKFTNFQCLAKEINKGKKKIFYGDCINSTQTIIDIWGINKDDYFVECSNPWGDAPIKDKNQIGAEKKGDFVVLVLPEASNGAAIPYLTEIGLEKNVDYFVLPALVLTSQGGYLL